MLLVIVTLNPHPSQYEETYNSLTFARKLKQFKPKSKQHESVYKLPMRPPTSDMIVFDNFKSAKKG